MITSHLNIWKPVMKIKRLIWLWEHTKIRSCSQNFETKYSKEQINKILKVINHTDSHSLLRYDITKIRNTKFTKWKYNNGEVKLLSDLEMIDGFNRKTAEKLFNSILKDDVKEICDTTKIKGRVLTPSLSENLRRNCKSVLAINTTVNSVSWTLIDRDAYELTDWQYYPMDYPDGKRLTINEILDVAWHISKLLPHHDICVMRGQPATLRSAGVDPANAKQINVNLQKSQLIAILVTLINTRGLVPKLEDEETKLKQKVYFLRPTLPFRLYGTLIGNERVSTETTIESIFSKSEAKNSNNSSVYIQKDLKTMYRNQNDLQRDMMGHCLLLALAFMDICIYGNENSIKKLSRFKEE